MTTMFNANHNDTDYDNKGRNVPSIIMLTLLRALRAIRANTNQNKFSYVPDAQIISGLELSL